MPNETSELDAYRLEKVEELAKSSAEELDKLKEREAVRDVEVKALTSSNNRYAAMLAALVIAVVGSAAAIILTGPHP